MRSAILILIVLAAGVAVAFRFHEIGGTVEIRVADHFVGVSFPIALLILIGFILAILGLVSLWGALRRAPARSRVRRTFRRRAEGDAAVTRALVALAAGTAEQARIEVRKARQNLGDTPQTLLLAAEAERMAGRDKAAEEVFRTLAQREDARFLGLRGLLRQAMARGDWDAALALAREAEATEPEAAAWLREERTQLALHVRDWREALALAPTNAARAPLALAAAAQERDTTRATDLERQAFEADPGFAPAALAYARRLRDGGNLRRSRSVLEEAWGKAPHPSLAEPYLAEERDVLMRVKAAEALIRRSPQHPESRLLLARTALDAGLTGRARNALESLQREGRGDRRAYLMLAELEEAERGDTPETRATQARLLREAATALPEPRWRCGNCGAEHAQWTPVCNACDTVGQIAWTGGRPGTGPATTGAPRVPAAVGAG
jgi:HemY protein